MSVRPTQTKSGYSRRSRQPYPTSESESELEPAAPGPAGPVSADAVLAEPVPELDPDIVSAPTEPGVVGSEPALPGAEVPTDPVTRVDRRNQRAARRTRRNLAIVCGVVVAVCLVLTILIVNMARNRPSGLDLVPRSVAAAVAAPSAAVHPSTAPVHPTRDAPSSEGGNR
jgi:hypothetical protein